MDRPTEFINRAHRQTIRHWSSYALIGEEEKILVEYIKQLEDQREQKRNAIAHIKHAMDLLERSKSNPEDNSQLVWNEQYDQVWQSLVQALDGLRGEME